MLSIRELIELVFKDLKKYATLYLRYYQLDFIDKTALLASWFLQMLIFLTLIFLMMFFSGIALALKISEWVNSNFWGFFTTALILLMLMVLFVIFGRKLILKKITGSLIRLFHGNEKKEDEKQSGFEE